jgi:hypothetical protein
MANLQRYRRILRRLERGLDGPDGEDLRRRLDHAMTRVRGENLDIEVTVELRDFITGELEAIKGVDSVHWTSDTDVHVTATLPVIADRIVVDASVTVKD